MERVLHEGRLVQIISKGRHYTDDGFATTSTSMCKDDHLILFESIDIGSYPGWDDFHGNWIKVPNGSFAAVLKYVGRPYQISAADRWCQYDIYEVLIDMKVCQVFRHNLQPVDSLAP